MKQQYEYLEIWGKHQKTNLKSFKVAVHGEKCLREEGHSTSDYKSCTIVKTFQTIYMYEFDDFKKYI